MRFSAVHKVSSYLMVGSAFAALALSGELPTELVVVTLLLGAASYFAEPSRFRFLRSRLWSRGWTVVTLAALAKSIADALRGDPPILTGVYFLCFFLVNKLWNRRTSRDYQQAYVLSFLMLVAGTTLNTDLVYALCFVAYVVFATWTLTLFHLRREMEENYLLKHSDDAQSERVEVERILNSRRVVGPAFLAGTSLVSLGIFLGSAALFFTFPRIGFGLFFHHGRAGLRMGFNDSGVELGGNGLIKDNDQVVMRVEFPDGKPTQPLYFRGIVFERYQHAPGASTAGWSPAPGRLRHDPRGKSGHSLGGVALVPSAVADRPTPKELRARIGAALRQEIYLEPMGEVSALFGAATPLGYELPGDRYDATLGDELQMDRLDDLFDVGRQQGIKYTAYSVIAPPPAALLDAQPDLPVEELIRRSDELRPSLQLPSDIPPRIVGLAREVTREARGPHQKVEALTAYLAKNYRYTVNLKRDPRYDPLEDFLFVQKEGHCEYFATALAVMLRAAGVPARHVAGFYGGEWNPYGNYLQVRQRDAHAWVEVYLGAAGWVTVDPTPPGEGLVEGSSVSDRLRQLADTVRLAWFKYVIEYDLGKQVDLFQGARRWLGDRAGGDGSGATPWQWLRAHLGRLAAGLGALVVAGALVWRRRRRRQSERPRAAKRTPALAALERAMRAVEQRGTARGAAETPAELAERARAAGDPGATPLAELVALYYAARWGGRPADPRELDRLAGAVQRPPQPPTV